MQLKILPRNIADMIAAGEVVQRPSSVVKELMENAVDAGADQISVTVTDAGRTLIQVIDNGCGMSPDDAVLCFERHATSKIATAEDLQEITTFGFRGEALASIAAVADVVLRTRREEDEVGVEVEISTDSSEKKYVGHVGYVSPEAEFTPKTVETPNLRTNLVYRARIVVETPDLGLRQGAPVSVKIPLGAAGTGELGLEGKEEQ